MRGYLTNWYRDDAEMFMEDMRDDLSTVLEQYNFHNEFVSTLTRLWIPLPVPSISLMKQTIFAFDTQRFLMTN